MQSPRIDSWRRDVRPRAFVVVFGLVVLLLVALMAGVIASPSLGRVDAQLSEAIRAIRTPWLTVVAKGVTRVGDASTMIALTLASVAGLLATRHRTGAVVVGLTVLGGRTLGSVVQVLVHRARPVDVALIPLPHEYSFPSGHALASALFFGAWTFFVLGEVRSPAVRYVLVALFALLAVGVGLSRVYLGVHYLGDVVAAWLLAGAVLTVAVLGFFALTQPPE